jgi:hypothetical protein
MDAPTYPATWMTRAKPHLAYRVMPKCGCSSVGQILHFLDHGRFYPGSIHDSAAPILKWQPVEGRQEIVEIFATGTVFRFTLVRNPYRRLLSSFADKIFGFQSNGKRYRRGEIHRALFAYGVNWGPKANIAANFKGFVRFVADTVEKRTPMASDLHWTPCFQHLKFNADCNPDWSLDFIGQLESFGRDMAEVLQRAGIGEAGLPREVPRENATGLPSLPISAFYGPEEIDIMRRVYAADFELFRYGLDPADTKPLGPIDLDRVNAAMRG